MKAMCSPGYHHNDFVATAPKCIMRPNLTPYIICPSAFVFSLYYINIYVYVYIVYNKDIYIYIYNKYIKVYNKSGDTKLKLRFIFGSLNMLICNLYLRPCQTSMMKPFGKIFNGLKLLTIFAKTSIIDV